MTPSTLDGSFSLMRVHALLPSTARWAALLLLATAGAVQAQTLPLKRSLPDAGLRCPATAAPVRPPSDEARAQASQLASSAAQAVILGDLPRARDLLQRATDLDPTSADLAYRYGQVLQDLGETRAAIDAFCRVLLLAPGSPDATDADARLDALTGDETPALTAEATTAFRAGITAFDDDRFRQSADFFDRAVTLAPGWADAVYNRGLARARDGQEAEAVADMREYLSMRPDAADALAVSQWIGQRQSAGPLPSPGAAFTLGLLLPGMGQFYSGRALGGFTVLTLAGGAAAAGFLIEEVKVRCLTQVPDGGDCPPSQILDEETERPYLVHGLAAAGAVTIIGAIEALVRARGRRARSESAGAALSARVGGTRLDGLTVLRAGRRVDVSLLRLRF